jgi:hypothetical protein
MIALMVLVVAAVAVIVVVVVAGDFPVVHKSLLDQSQILAGKGFVLALAAVMVVVLMLNLL